jgi:hypothetical protein
MALVVGTELITEAESAGTVEKRHSRWVRIRVSQLRFDLQSGCRVCVWRYQSVSTIAAPRSCVASPNYEADARQHDAEAERISRGLDR